MADTLKHLQGISDDTFERLVAAYLRRRDIRLSNLIMTGMNEQWEAVPCPVDNILYVPGEPPVCVSVATTTTEYKDLRVKWFGKTVKGVRKKGDIEKSLEEFQKWRDDLLNVRCVLYLATNKTLKSDLTLYRDAVSYGQKNDVDVIIIEASILLDFLDLDSEGQYIRNVLFDINAERLSEDLLRTIAQQSLDYHCQTFSFIQEGERIEITRTTQEQVTELLKKSSKPLIGLHGASGVGKSTLLRQIGRSINGRYGIALWLPAENIIPGYPISTILLNTLRRFSPSLSAYSGEEAIKIAETIPGGIVLLVDDVNRLRSSLQTLRFLETLSRASSQAIRYIVPLWPGQLADSGNEQEKKKIWDFVELIGFSSIERQNFSNSLSISKDSQIRKVIDTLNGDPFLCGLASLETIPLNRLSNTDLLHEILESALKQMLKQAQQNSGFQASLDEFYNAIDNLVEYIIKYDSPEPRWKEIRNELEKESLSILLWVASNNQIGWISANDGKETWKWKHNRLRDVIVGRWIANNILLRIEDNDLTDRSISYLTNPGLAESIALSLVFLPKNDQERILRLIGNYQPLVLAEILRSGTFPEEESIRTYILTTLRQIIY